MVKNSFELFDENNLLLFKLGAFRSSVCLSVADERTTRRLLGSGLLTPKNTELSEVVFLVFLFSNVWFRNNLFKD